MRAHRPESMRRHNERLVLTLLRREGAMPRSLLAQATGLSAQAAGNIVKGLIDRGLIAPEARVRGRVGQPTVPLRLAARGAFFLGLKIGRRSVQMVLVDFSGTILAREEARYADPAPAPEAVVAFAREAAARLVGGEALTGAERDCVRGVGIAMPFRLWDWQTGFAPWQGRDLRAEVEAATGLPAWLENDASCACAAELIFGRRDLPRDFLHVHIGHFAGGGLVLGGRLWLGPRGNAAAIGSTPVPDGAGVVQLLQRASLASLERRLGAMLLPGGDWQLPEGARRAWLAEAGGAIAFAALSAATILDLDAVVIDGDVPADLRAALVAEVAAALHQLPAAGVVLPRIVAGSFGGQARALGAAALPLAEGFMLDVLTPSPATGG